jgi:uncharacterized membrane-anchored protein
VGELVAHPWRGRVLAELHARPPGLLATPQRILHYAFATDPEAAAADREAIAEYVLSLPPKEGRKPAQ